MSKKASNPRRPRNAAPTGPPAESVESQGVQYDANRVITKYERRIAALTTQVIMLETQVEQLTEELAGSAKLLEEAAGRMAAEDRSAPKARPHPPEGQTRRKTNQK